MLTLVAALVACDAAKGSRNKHQEDAGTLVQPIAGATGGTVERDGVMVVVPPGGFPTDVDIRIDDFRKPVPVDAATVLLGDPVQVDVLGKDGLVAAADLLKAPFQIVLFLPAGTPLDQIGALILSPDGARATPVSAAELTIATDPDGRVRVTIATRATSAGYVLVKTVPAVGRTWQQQAYVKAPDAAAHDGFGDAVAMSGDVLVVGAHFERSGQTTVGNGPSGATDESTANVGAVYVFRRTGGVWGPEAFLKAPVPQDGHFGAAVAVSGDTVVVGAPRESGDLRAVVNGTAAATASGRPRSGAAYVFRKVGGAWALEAYLKAANADVDDAFGTSVAISGDAIVVGASGEDARGALTAKPEANDAIDAGAAYVFRRTGSQWAQEAYLKASNGEDKDVFGRAVAISGDTVVVGAPGEAGSSRVTHRANFVIDDDNAAPNAGAGYVFERKEGKWQQKSYLKSPRSEENGSFGTAVAIDGRLLVVGALYEGTTGAAYVYEDAMISTWIYLATLAPPGLDTFDMFGAEVSLSGDVVVVGAYNEDSAQTVISKTPSTDNTRKDAGAAYVFRKGPSGWALEAFVKSANARPDQSFGRCVAASAGSVAVCAPGDASAQTTVTNGEGASSDETAKAAGAAFIYVPIP